MSDLADVLAALGMAAFERDGTGALLAIEPCPRWGPALVLAEDVDQAAPFLADFLVEAESLWTGTAAGRLRSDAWVQALAGEREPVALSALATRTADGRCTLVVRRLLDFDEERRVPLQAARDALLDRQRLLKEIEKKEVLLHCIVHDLKGPLAGMLGSFSLLAGKRLAPDRAEELVRLGDEQARKQQAMIAGLLDVFAAEVSELESFETEPDRAPDLALAAADVVRGLGPAFERKHVALVLEPAGPGPWRVHGRREPLERVLSNLVENALRHAPRGTAVRVRASVLRDGARRRLTVEDRGPGVPDELGGQLFEKFVRGSGGGAAGLGLYFARITVERWGGAIGHEPAADGRGARFWFELPAATGLERRAPSAR